MIYVTHIHVTIGIYIYIYIYIKKCITLWNFSHCLYYRAIFGSKVALLTRPWAEMSQELSTLKKALVNLCGVFFGLQYPYTPKPLKLSNLEFWRKKNADDTMAEINLVGFGTWSKLFLTGFLHLPVKSYDFIAESQVPIWYVWSHGPSW